jgi:hypothetical protein
LVSSPALQGVLYPHEDALKGKTTNEDPLFPSMFNVRRSMFDVHPPYLPPTIRQIRKIRGLSLFILFPSAFNVGRSMFVYPSYLPPHHSPDS